MTFALAEAAENTRNVVAPREVLNKSILDLSALVTGKRGFPVTHKINR